MKEWLKSFFQNFVKNLKTIIFALVIAVIVWFAISMQIFPDVTTHVSYGIYDGKCAFRNEQLC